MALLNWMGEHPVLGFLLACLVYYTIRGGIWVIALPFRAMNIRKHGWPPEYLDADGDYKKPKAEQKAGEAK